MSEFPGATSQRPGIVEQLDPLVVRVLAPNPSPFTQRGTQTYIVGTTDVAVIDPGPDDPNHIAALLSAIGDRPVLAILVTHHHRDHSPASRPLRALTGAPIVGCATIASLPDLGGLDAAFDAGYAPDRVLSDGDCVSGAGWTIETVATPGHSSNHLAFALPEVAALFSGDHVMGWSTSVVSPPDGRMADYLRSLERLLGRREQVYYPGHGDPVTRPERLVRGMIAHRRQRVRQILRLLQEAPHSTWSLAAAMYVGLDPALIGAARQSILAHLIDLADQGLVVAEDSVWASTTAGRIGRPGQPGSD